MNILNKCNMIQQVSHSNTIPLKKSTSTAGLRQLVLQKGLQDVCVCMSLFVWK